MFAEPVQVTSVSVWMGWRQYKVRLHGLVVVVNTTSTSIRRLRHLVTFWTRRWSCDKAESGQVLHLHLRAGLVGM